MNQDGLSDLVVNGLYAAQNAVLLSTTQ